MELFLDWFVPRLLNGLSFGALLFLIASGLTLTFGLMNTLNLAHGGFYILGGYLALDFLRLYNNYWLAVVLAVTLVALLGALFQRLLLHRVIGPEGHLPQILLTIGFLFLMSDQILAHYGGRTLFPPRPPGLEGVTNLGSITVPVFRLALIAVAFLAWLVTVILVRRTRVGAMVRAAVDDQHMAQVIGIPVPRLFMGVFAFGTALAAFAGVWGGAFTGLSPGIELSVLILAVVVIVVGGMGSISGAAIAAALVGLADEFGKALFPEFAMFTIYVPVVLFLVLRPQGLLGQEAA